MKGRENIALPYTGYKVSFLHGGREGPFQDRLWQTRAKIKTVRQGCIMESESIILINHQIDHTIL